ETGKGFVILSCELIDNNGKELEKCVLQYAAQWNLGDDFTAWIQDENIFCSTLVDRIVTGYPRAEADSINEENGYIDQLIDTGEIFGFWVIEGPQSLKKELPFEEAGLPVLITDNHKPYKQRKVRILNGAHTSFVLGAYLAGQNIVRDCMNDEVIRGFMNKTIYEEIIPTLTLPKAELEDFAASVTERFKNPFIDHALLAISLNSTSKWKARVMPSLKGYLEKTGKLPACITASFAFYIAFFNGDHLAKDSLTGHRGTEEYAIKDDRCVLEFFEAHKDDSAAELAHAVCTNESFWGEDLSLLDGFESAVAGYLEEIRTQGAYEVMKRCLAE
ncbi:MAG: tagaturonate reductase, partial [Schaedlerella arabinosiphila]|nr:tagaturonate reductase [Schaedlerella arabinosiphila]